jgi:hypothetical protein
MTSQNKTAALAELLAARGLRLAANAEIIAGRSWPTRVRLAADEDHRWVDVVEAS